MKKPKVIISILNWQNYQNTITCIQSLQTINYDNLDIIVVDNNSPNDSYEIISKTFPQLNVLKSKYNNGYAAGHKIVADIAIEQNADLLWVLNNDLEVRENTLSELVNAYIEFGEGIYGSTTLLSQKPDIINFGGGDDYLDKSQPFSYNIFYKKNYSEEFKSLKTRNIQSIEGSSMLIPIKIIKEIGFMNSDYFMYGEETDYCFYARAKGIPSILATNSVVIHKGGGSFENNTELSIIETYYRQRNFIFFCKKYYNWKNKDVFERYSEFFSLLKFFIKYWLSKSSTKKKTRLQYYGNLATVHGLLGRMGKLVKPERYIQLIKTTITYIVLCIFIP